MSLAETLASAASLHHLVVAGTLLALSAALSILLRLQIGQSLAIAAIRAVVQLAALGVALKAVIASQSYLWAALLAVAMILLAAYEFGARQTWRLAGLRIEALGLAAMTLLGCLAALYAMAVLKIPKAETTLRDGLVLVGLLLAHGLTAMAVAIDQLFAAALRERPVIEARLALGHARLAALLPVVRTAARTALLPTIAGMATAGFVGMPDLMAGHILAGSDALEAIMLQIEMMLVIGSATTLAVIAAGLAGVYLLTDRRHRLRTDRLERRRT